jgi:signal transduction histidine kinase
LLRKEAPRHDVVDLNRIIEEVIDLLRATLERQRVAIHTDLAASLPPIMGDPVQLQQVLVNLITNAAEAMRETAGRRRIATIRSQLDDNGCVIVSVEDTGVGLDPQNIDRIFDSFYTTKAEGIGVGLSISRSIVEAHGGQLSAAPAAPHGARFSFTVPIAQEPSLPVMPAKVAAIRARKPAGYAGAKPKSPRR